MKVESKLRRLAISEKYKQWPKEQQLEQEELQQQQDLQHAEVDMKKVVIVDSEVMAEENRKRVTDNMEVRGAEHILNSTEFRLEKNAGDGMCRNESVVVAGGLGQGLREDILLGGSSGVITELSQPPPEWLPSKHKIFLSHSGYQKAFTEHLCEKLEAVQSGEGCEVLRSHNASSTRMPSCNSSVIRGILHQVMMELNEFVRALDKCLMT